MKPATKQLVIELAATAVASPLLIILLARIRAFGVLAFLAIPTLPLGQVLSSRINAISPPDADGWFPALGATILVEMILVPLWTWILLMILVTLVKRLIPKRESA